jgi:acid phosphatase family membrane protein YuiD
MVLIAALFFVIITMESCSKHSDDDGDKAISSLREKLSKEEHDEAIRRTYTFVRQVEGHDYVITVYNGCSMVHAESCSCKSK